MGDDSRRPWERRYACDAVARQGARLDFQALIYPGRTQRIEPACVADADGLSASALVPPSGGTTGLADTPAWRRPATNSPPVFLVCGYNDRPDISEGLASVYLEFKQLKVPTTLHQLSTLNSRKQNGLRANDPKPAGKWIERFAEWLSDGGFLKKE